MSVSVDKLPILPSVKLLLGVRQDDPSQDVLLSYLIAGAASAITYNLNRPFLLASNAANPITEYHSGTNDEWLVLRLWPVQSITSIYLDDGGYWGQAPNAFATPTLLTQGTDYALNVDTPSGASRSGMVLRINNVWESAWVRDGGMLASRPEAALGNVKVTYTYGFTSLPDDLAYAAATVVARMYNTAKFGQGITSENYEEYGVSLRDNAAPWLGLFGGEVAPILARYRIASVGAA